MFKLIVVMSVVVAGLYVVQCESPAAGEGEKPPVVVGDTIIPTVNLSNEFRMITPRSGSFTVTARLDTPANVSVAVPYSVTGTASGVNLHTVSDGAFVFAPGDTVQTMTVDVVNTEPVKGFFDLVIKLDSTEMADLGARSTDSVVIACNAIDRFQIPDGAINGWNQRQYDSDLFVAEGEGLYDIINGGATPYITFNYQTALWQVLENVGGQTMTIMAMEYALQADADSIFQMKTMPASEDEESTFTHTLTGYTYDNVRGTEVIGGMMYIMRFGTIYFEITISGFSDSNSAVPAALGTAEYLHTQL